MSGKYDIESFINEMVSIVQAGLPAKITSINTEKSDSNSITQIDNANYYQDISDQIINVNPFIYYTMVDIQSTSNGAVTMLNITLAMSVVFDNTNSTGTMQKVLRYSRALREVIQEAFKQQASNSRLEISEFVPTDMEINSGSDFKIGGIHINSSIVG